MENSQPQQTSIQEALQQVKSWISSGEKEKASQGLHEILEHDPKNIEAKTLLEQLQETTIQRTPLPQAPLKSATSQPATPESQTPQPVEPKSATLTAAKQPIRALQRTTQSLKVKKYIALAVSGLILVVGVFMLFNFFFGESVEGTDIEGSFITNEQEETVTDTITKPETTESVQEKVKRR